MFLYYEYQLYKPKHMKRAMRKNPKQPVHSVVEIDQRPLKVHIKKKKKKKKKKKAILMKKQNKKKKQKTMYKNWFFIHEV